MTHPPGQPGGGGGSDGGNTGPGRIFDSVMARWDSLVEAVLSRMGNAVIANDLVARADAGTSIADLRAAYHLANGRSADELNRDGWPVTR